MTRFSIPNGTIIPARGHFLGVNSVGYSLASYPSGASMTANGDKTFIKDIPDNAGVALFDNDTGGASYALAHRLDAVGTTAEPKVLYRKGAGLPPLTPFSVDHSWVRKFPGTGDVVPTSCLAMKGAALQNTNDNAADFYYVDTNGTSSGAGQRLGAPGPQNLFSPIQSLAPSASAMKRLDPSETVGSAPNMVRSATPDVLNNSSFGTLEVRRTFTNETAANITRLRFRVIALSTFPAPSGTADLRARSSTNILTMKGTTLEQPATQANGGAFNSSLSVDAITIANPLAPGASVDVRLLFGIQQTGKYQMFVEVEALPSATRQIWGIVGDTEKVADTVDCAPEAEKEGGAQSTGAGGAGCVAPNATGESENPSSSSSSSSGANGEPTSEDGVEPAVESGCNAGRRADAPSVSLIAVLLAAVIVASRRKHVL